MNFLNNGTGYALFSLEVRKKAYVDKSLLIHDVYQYANDTNRFICITRPRRFGKSVAANMLSAFFDASTAKLRNWSLGGSGRRRRGRGKLAGIFLSAGRSRGNAR